MIHHSGGAIRYPNVENRHFYRSALNAGRSSEEKAVRLSVRLSVKRLQRNKMEEKSVQILIPYEISFSLVFFEKNGWWGRPFLLEILGQPPFPHLQFMADSVPTPQIVTMLGKDT